VTMPTPVNVLIFVAGEPALNSVSAASSSSQPKHRP
jgi:hypothetical protein